MDIGGVDCELTDHFSNPVIFQCGLEKISTYEVKKAQGSLLVNEFSAFQTFLSWSPGKSLQKRVLWVTYRRNCFACMYNLEYSAGYWGLRPKSDR